MLKSLFFKPKANTDELLPPPPPFPSMEFEEQAVSENRFQELFEDAEKDADIKKDSAREAKTKVPKKLLEEEPKKINAIGKAKKQQKKEKEVEPEDEFFNLGEEFGLDVEEEPKSKEFDELGISNADFEEEIGAEKDEAGQEIKNAIDDAKRPDKKSFLGGLFRKKEAKIAPELLDNFDAIKSRMAHARQALMNLDLKGAKWDYIEIMRIYNKLKPEEQAKVYHEIQDFYYERKNAEELKI
ncbi:hypothetical protein HY637_02175 [Candidatus Woesearchaeota archaeon]|nr:hypothetical protein [Candidatus Woesearchaeota archaeon]